MYRLDDYDYHLPEALIAQTPAPNRAASRLLHLDRGSGTFGHHHFRDIINLLSPGDLLVINDTKVIPGRLFGRKASGGKVETLILDYADGTTGKTSEGEKERIQRCLIKSSKRLRPGTWIQYAPDLKAEVLAYADGIADLRFVCRKEFEEALHNIGKVPLPPYIRRDYAQQNDQAMDRKAYQTVYAAHSGAIAAPTAGLHFTEEILQALKDKGICIVSVTLHVGYGTFLPVRVADIREHQMHAEGYTISRETAESINRARKEGRRVIAVGTTSVRTLEYHSDHLGMLTPGSGSCDLFIYPGYRFKVINGLITNFHLPRSTLLMLVSALVGRETILSAYKNAVESRYRFFSYGDAMLIL